MEHYIGLQKHKKKYLFIFLMISLNYKCSKDTKTGLGLVRGCLVQILSQYLESQVPRWAGNPAVYVTAGDTALHFILVSHLFETIKLLSVHVHT